MTVLTIYILDIYRNTHWLRSSAKYSKIRKVHDCEALLQVIRIDLVFHPMGGFGFLFNGSLICAGIFETISTGSIVITNIET